MTGAWILYGLVLLLAVVFWLRIRNFTLGQLFDQSSRHHHHVLAVLDKHPHGGTWRQFRSWMGGK